MLRRSSHRLGLKPLWLATVIVALPASAWAEQAVVERAASSQSDYRKAHEAARSHDWLEARRILLGLWQRAQTYDVAASLSEAEYALGHTAASARYMDFALRHVTPNESPATVANMKAALDKLRAKVGAVKISVDEPGGSLSLDGVHLDYDPEGDVFVEPGTHVFALRSGSRESSRAIDAGAGSSQVLRLRLPPAAPAPEAAPLASTAPTADAPRRDSQARTIALFVGGALAVGGLGTGIGFGLSSNASEHDVQDYRARVGSAGCPSANGSSDCAALQSAVDSQRRKTHVANIGYGVAAAGLVTVGVALLWPRSHRAASANAAPLELRFSGSAMSLRGAF